MLTGYQAFETLAMEAGKWRAGVLALLMMLRNERGWRAVVVWMDPRLCLPRLADRGVPVTREAWAFVLAWRECASWDRRSMGKSSPSVQLMTLRARRTPWGIPLGVVGPDEAFEKLVMDVGKWRAGVVGAAHQARVEGGGGGDGSSFVPRCGHGFLNTSSLDDRNTRELERVLSQPSPKRVSFSRKQLISSFENTTEEQDASEEPCCGRAGIAARRCGGPTNTESTSNGRLAYYQWPTGRRGRLSVSGEYSRI